MHFILITLTLLMIVLTSKIREEIVEQKLIVVDYFLCQEQFILFIFFLYDNNIMYRQTHFHKD